MEAVFDIDQVKCGRCYMVYSRCGQQSASGS